MAESKEMSRDELRKMQLIQLEILIEFDRVCRENNIKYIMDAGTLLGAVRHNGFIPWDDDIDIRMLRSEYDKFKKIAGAKLQNGIYFQDHYNDKYYLWFYSKVRKEGTKAIRVGQEKIPMKNGVFIDIFPCDGIPDDKKAFKMKCWMAYISRKILYAKIAKHTANSLVSRIKWNVIAIIPQFVPHKCLNYLSKKYPDVSAGKVGCLGWHALKDINGFDKRWFTEVCELEFEGHMFMAPKDYDGFLKFSFGDDYMTPPPVSQRVTSAPLSSFYLGE